MGRGLKVAEFRWLFCCYEDFGLGRIEVAQSHAFTDEQAKEILRKHNPELRRVFLIAGAPNLGTWRAPSCVAGPPISGGLFFQRLGWWRARLSAIICKRIAASLPCAALHKGP